MYLASSERFSHKASSWGFTTLPQWWSDTRNDFRYLLQRCPLIHVINLPALKKCICFYSNYFSNKEEKLWFLLINDCNNHCHISPLTTAYSIHKLISWVTCIPCPNLNCVGRSLKEKTKLILEGPNTMLSVLSV